MSIEGIEIDARENDRIFAHWEGFYAVGCSGRILEAVDTKMHDPLLADMGIVSRNGGALIGYQQYAPPVSAFVGVYPCRCAEAYVSGMSRDTVTAVLDDIVRMTNMRVRDVDGGAIQRFDAGFSRMTERYERIRRLSTATGRPLSDCFGAVTLSRHLFYFHRGLGKDVIADNMRKMHGVDIEAF